MTTTEHRIGRSRTLVAAYGVLSAAVLATVVVLSITGHPVTSFLWGRSSGVLASAAVMYWLTGLAARGDRSAWIRVRIISIVMPVAIVAVDLIPGLCPPWFVVVQAVCAVPIAAAAFLVNGPAMRASFAR